MGQGELPCVDENWQRDKVFSMYPSKFSKSPAVAILLNNLLNSTFSVKKKNEMETIFDIAEKSQEFN